MTTDHSLIAFDLTKFSKTDLILMNRFIQLYFQGSLSIADFRSFIIRLSLPIII